MSLENRIRVLAGTLVLSSVALSLLHSQWWLLLTGFVGFNLVQSAFTRFCPAEIFLKKLMTKSASGN